MLTIKITTQFNNYCELTINDTTGYTAVDNLGGFIPEGVATTGNNQYHISDGYFFNILSYNGYNCTPIILNPTDVPIHVLTSNVAPVYTNNNFTYTYTLTSDGLNVFSRVFIISKSFYESKPLSFFEGKTIIYYDPATDKLYKIVNSLPVEITKLELLLGLSETITGDYEQISLLSVCKLNSLHYKLETKLVNDCILICYEKVDKQLIIARDYIFMLLNVIKYLKQLNQISEAQRVIESSNINCSLFENLLGGINSKSCNCNG